VTSAPPEETMLEIDVRKDRGHTVVEVAGELDVFTSARLRTVLFDPVLCGGPRVVVDLTRVTFIDSTSIGVLVAARRWLSSRDAEVRLVSVDGPVLKVLGLVMLDKVFAIHPSVDDAVTAP
jgi:anti-sigma B factor antagonist